MRETFKMGAVALAATAGAIALQWGHPLNADEGVVLNAAWKLYGGQVLYRDFFEYIAPGSFYTVLGIFKIFGPSYVAVKIIFVSMLIASGMVFLFMGRGFLSRTQRLATGGAWIMLASIGYPVVNHNTLSALGALATLGVLMYAFERPRWFVFGYAGMLTGGVFSILQTKGLALAGVIVLLLCFEAKRKQISLSALTAYILGFCAVIGVAVGIWGTEMILSLVAVGRGYLAYNAISNTPLVLFVSIAGSIFAWAWHAHPEQRRMIRLLAAYQCALVASVLNRPDVPHLILGLFPLVLLCAIVSNDIRMFVGRNVMDARWMRIIMIVVLVLLGISGGWVRLKRLNISKNIRNEVAHFVKHDTFVAWPFLPGLYFELHKNNPYQVSVSESLAIRPDIASLMLETLEKENPRYAITNYVAIRKFNYRHNPIDDYIATKYHLVRSYEGQLVVLERNQ